MYLLVTPVRNEEDKLKDFIRFVKEQSLPPLLWVIVNDGSTDSSVDIIKAETKEDNYIYLLNLEEKDDYGQKSYNRTVNYGFNFIIEYIKRHHIKYKYLGILDADIFVEKTFFEKLVDTLDKNEKLGIVSGQLYVLKNGDQKKPENMGKHLWGGCMVYKKECFEEIGGFPRCTSGDSVTCIKAKLKGWQILRVFEAKAIHKRYVTSKEGRWKSHFKVGYNDYYLNFSIGYAFLTAFFWLIKPPFYSGIAYLAGYFKAFFKKGEKFQDPELKKYFTVTRVAKEKISFLTTSVLSKAK
ncbi:hypothetical protein DK28_0211560 [Peptococcaceae bacterium SCADC1_2_3]|jgi:GT2 family glycosyltransferase|nr:hypothetical protein DK28_0211560 [Peptococcaceae bacterium SCADC1_2_3]KFI35152.1 hypothetical protein HY00_07045 [Peptococcaceae bacterium SCADC1_2_3]